MDKNKLTFEEHRITSALASLRPLSAGIGNESPADTARDDAITAIGKAVLTIIDELKA